MKKNAIRFSVALVALFGVVSCGGNMTAEEIQAEAEKRFNEKKTELAEAAQQDCEGNMPAYTQMMLDSIQMANTGM